MNDLHRSSNETQDMASIKMLGQKLAESTAELAKWAVGLQVVIEQPSLDLKITVRKPNGQGFIKTIPKDQVLYYTKDAASLINELTDDIFENLLKDQIKSEISTVVSNAVSNVTLMSNKS